MQAFKNFTGMVAPLDRANVDTDQIIPKQFLKAVVLTGLKKGLFIDWRLNSDGTENKEFALNKPRFQGASILIARNNFGCGSSRKHAALPLGVNFDRAQQLWMRQFARARGMGAR